MAIQASRLAFVKVVRGQRGTQGAARIAGSGLNPDVLKTSIAQDPAIGHAIQCHSSSETQVFCPSLFRQGTGHAQYHFFQTGLN